MSGSHAETQPDSGLLVDVHGQVGSLTLNRPAALNALTLELGALLLDAVDTLAADERVRVIVLGGAGRAFCSGIDLKRLQALGDPEAQVRGSLQEVFHPLVLKLRTVEKPVIAAVGGTAVGIGCALALASDLVIAGRCATFHVAFANIGLGVDGGTSALLTGRVGHARASQMALMADPLPAAQALEWGLINSVVDDGELDAAVAAAAGRLVRASPGALAAIKRALNEAAYPHLAGVLALETELQTQRAGSADFAEAVRAFTEKRPPNFTAA
jgi:2-(1,2-epoxy-1,2-dihydrophenyl)acetyl-CoA isomerase